MLQHAVKQSVVYGVCVCVVRLCVSVSWVFVSIYMRLCGFLLYMCNRLGMRMLICLSVFLCHFLSVSVCVSIYVGVQTIP